MVRTLPWIQGAGFLPAAGFLTVPMGRAVAGEVLGWLALAGFALAAGLAIRAGRTRIRDLEARAAHHQAMLGSAADGVWLMDGEGRFLECNGTACLLVGYSREELLGMTLAEVEASESAGDIRIHLARIRERGSDLFQTVIRRKDGSFFPAEVSATFQAGAGTCLAYLRDITELQRAARERHQLQVEVEHMQRMESLGRMAGGVAQDMSNLMGSIYAVTQTLRARHRGARDLDEALATVERAALRGRELVKGLLRFARKDLGATIPMELNDLVRREAALLELTLQHPIHLEVDLEEGLEPILGDSGALASALMNLCVNAVDAMPRGGTLTLRTRALPGGRQQLAVEDTGEGMPASVLKRAMEPFFTTKAFGHGTGLGLGVVFSTARAHGGTFTLHSQQGLGTQALITLPPLPGGEAAPELPPTGDRRRASGDPGLSPGQVGAE